ncbi:MAG: hypothetical protein IKU72_03170 [Oscillospiraceae bacterium]|nr:hypothetical protein [Oscillospiraceae bacterium]
MDSNNLGIGKELAPNHEQHHHHLHIGMRKWKSIFAMFLGFCVWQTLRLFIPGLEVHPLFIYLYAMIEIRETSSKTVDYGKKRIKVTLISIGIGIPFMLFVDRIRPLVSEGWMITAIEVSILLAGSMLVLCIAEWADCHVYCSLSVVIFIILMLGHYESAKYLYSLMRVFQTVIGVTVAWFVNVVLLPYPPKPGSLSEKFSIWYTKRKQLKNSEETP